MIKEKRTIPTARCHGKQVNLVLDPALVKKMDSTNLPEGGGRAVKIEAGIRLLIESLEKQNV